MPINNEEERHPVIYYNTDQNIMIPVNNNPNLIVNNNMPFINPCNLPPHATLFKRNPYGIMGGGIGGMPIGHNI